MMKNISILASLYFLHTERGYSGHRKWSSILTYHPSALSRLRHDHVVQRRR